MTKGLEKNKLNDSDVNSVPDARRKFAAETNLSARICNAADGMLFTSESFSLFFSSPLTGNYLTYFLCVLCGC